MRGFFGIVAFVLAVAFALHSYIYLSMPWAVGAHRTPHPDRERQAHYREVCAPIIEWLGEQRRRTGHYPDRLSETHDEAFRGLDPWARYWAFGPGVRGTEPCFVLKIGDYRRYHWEYYYLSRLGDWFLDS